MKTSVRQRLLSAATILLLLAAVVFCNSFFPPALNIVLAVISVMGIWELFSALHLTKKLALSVPKRHLAAVLPFLPDSFARGVAFFLYTVVLFSAMIRHHQTITFREVAVIYSMTILIPTALETLVGLRNLGGSHGMFYVIVTIFAAWPRMPAHTYLAAASANISSARTSARKRPSKGSSRACWSTLR